jgi:hypothetical protein
VLRLSLLLAFGFTTGVLKYASMLIRNNIQERRRIKASPWPYVIFDIEGSVKGFEGSVKGFGELHYTLGYYVGTVRFEGPVPVELLINNRPLERVRLIQTGPESWTGTYLTQPTILYPQNWEMAHE